MNNPPTTLGKLAAYNNWANEKLLLCLEEIHPAVPAESMRLLSHIFNAQVIWLSRIEGTECAIHDTFELHELNTCRALHEKTSVSLLHLVESPENQLEEVVHYTNMKGDPFETQLHDILTHLFNHSTYHRAQIAQNLRQHNLTPVNTDYILFVRSLINYSYNP